MYYLAKSFKFDAAHSLGDGYIGKCNKTHGHCWEVIFKFKSNVLDKFGMVLDFTEIKKIWEEHLEPKLDHEYLNESIGIQPTAENLAKYIFTEFERYLNIENVKLISVSIYETATSGATYQPV